jgi:5-methylcytosine-specific restriction endonuclease McrA
MSIIATAVKHLMAAGVTGDALIAAIADMEEQVAPSRSKAAERTDKYRQRRNLSDQDWALLTAQVIERDGWICSYCDIDISTSDVRHAIDHVYPLSKGGTNELDNLCMSCQPCNSSKGDKILDEEWSPPNDEFIAWVKGEPN